MTERFKNGVEKYDKNIAAEVMINYLLNVEVSKSRIGDFDASVRNGVKDIIASGHQIFEFDEASNNSPLTIFTKTSKTVLDKSPLFKNNFNMSSVKIIEDYMKEKKFKKETMIELVEKLKDIENRKSLVVTIKPQKNYRITATINGKKVNDIYKSKYLKWSTNHENYKLECVVAFEINADSKIVRLPLSEYGKTFVTDKLAYWDGIIKTNKTLIEMTDLGIIKPIEITDGVQSLVVDGTFLYLINSGGTMVIGEWNNKTNEMCINEGILKTLSKTEIFKFFNTNIPLIKGHRMFIAPYNMFDIHKHNIKVKKAKKGE